MHTHDTAVPPELIWASLGIPTVTDPATGRTYPVPAGGSGNEPPPEPDPDPDDDPDDDPDEFDEDRAREKIRKANSEAANLRKRLKEAEAKAKRLDELEDAQKSEVEKATEKVSAAEKRAQEAELRALRLEVAADKGLTPTQARRLVGSSKEELEEDADDLLASFAPTEENDSPRRPKEKLRPGAGSPDDEPEETDPSKLADMVPPMY